MKSVVKCQKLETNAEFPTLNINVKKPRLREEGNIPESRDFTKKVDGPSNNIF